MPSRNIILSLAALAPQLIVAQPAAPPFKYSVAPAVDYSQIYVPPNYCNSSYSTRQALSQRKDGLRGRTLRVSVGTGTVTSKMLSPDNFMRILPDSPAIAAWDAINPGETLRVADSDVTGLLKWMFTEVRTPAVQKPAR